MTAVRVGGATEARTGPDRWGGASLSRLCQTLRLGHEAFRET